MIKFISAHGYSGGSCYVQFSIAGGDSSYCIGDQIWCDEHNLEIADFIEKEALEEFFENCASKSVKAFKGALRRAGVI